jgi:crotonobetainyl-CoA:carnitine CoA-transferase CaiB-like acyl-CoA transferase
MQHGLSDLRVIDFSDAIAGSYAAKLLADAGAEVIKVEPPGGDPMRAWSEQYFRTGVAPEEGDSALFRFLNTSKLSVTGAFGEAPIAPLLAGADIVINNFPPGTLDAEVFCHRHPRAVLLSITPWGHSGPWRHRPATEFILQAESGSLSGRGLLEQPPVMAGGRITEWVAGTYAAVAALAAAREARRSGIGDHIDFSLLEVMTIAGTGYADLMAGLAGRPAPRGPMRTVEVPSIEPTKDGWVGFNTNSNQQYTDFLVLIGRTDLLEDKELATIFGRTARMDEWNRVVRAWTREHTTAEIVEAAALLRIPVAPVNNGRTVLEHEHFKARGVFVKNPGGDFLQPRPPYRVNGELPGALRPAPAIGEHNHAVGVKPPRANGGEQPPAAPLAGLRVLDATAWWAGPSATQMLAHLGAEVIHLEAIQRPDGMRMLGGRFMHKPRWWEYSGMYLGANTNKLGLTLDLDQAEGVAIAKQLIARCDVFVENYSPRVMEKFGLDWKAVHALNPRTIMVRMPAFGLSGPWRDHVGFAQTMEQITGMAWITGFKEDQPRIQRGPCDPLAGMHAAFATLVALAEREATGRGSFVECPMVEGALNAAAEQIVEYSAYGNLLERDGNRCAQAAPQGLYACKGHRLETEQWLALSVETQAQWRALKDCLGHPAALEDEQFQSHGGRLSNHDELDRVLAGLFGTRELEETIEVLVAAGVPAGHVWPGVATSLHPQLQARGFYERVAHPVVGEHYCVTTPFRSRHVGRWIRRPAPVLGQDNHRILRSVLGYSDEQVAMLEEREVIGTIPRGLAQGISE